MQNAFAYQSQGLFFTNLACYEQDRKDLPLAQVGHTSGIAKVLLGLH